MTSTPASKCNEVTYWVFRYSQAKVLGSHGSIELTHFQYSIFLGQILVITSSQSVIDFCHQKYNVHSGQETQFSIKMLLYYRSVIMERISGDVNGDYEDESFMVVVYSDGMKDVVESSEEVEWFGISTQTVSFVMLMMMLMMTAIKVSGVNDDI